MFLGNSDDDCSWSLSFVDFFNILEGIGEKDLAESMFSKLSLFLGVGGWMVYVKVKVLVMVLPY